MLSDTGTDKLTGTVVCTTVVGIGWKFEKKERFH